MLDRGWNFTNTATHSNWRVPQLGIEAAKKWSCRNDAEMILGSWVVLGWCWSPVFIWWRDSQAFFSSHDLIASCVVKGATIKISSTFHSLNQKSRFTVPVISQCIERHNCWNTVKKYLGTNHQWRVFQSYVKARKDISLWWGASSTPVQIWAGPSRARQRARWAAPTSTQHFLAATRQDADGDGAISRCRAWNPWILQWAPMDFTSQISQEC